MRVYIKVMAMSLSFHNLCAEAITEENIRYFHVSSLPAAAEVKPPIVSPVNPVPPVTPVKKPPIVPPVNHVPPGPPVKTPPIVPPVNPVPPGPPVKTPPIVPPAPPVTPPIVPLVNPVTPPPSSVPLTSVEGILKDTSDLIFLKQISDHALAGEMIDGDIPVYTWNTWGYGAMGGFSANRESNLAAYKTGRLQEQIGILFKIFHNSPNAIICLQEVNEQDAGTRTAILNGLKALNVDCEYVEKTGKDLFGQMTLYRKDRYKPVRAFKPTPNGYSSGVAMPFISTADTRQNARVLKVYFEELTGKKRQLAVVNVHLAYNSPNILGLLNELVTYSQGVSSPKPLAVITGDFNDTISARYPSSGKVTVKQVGKSVIWNGTASSTKQTANNVDGFIVVQP